MRGNLNNSGTLLPGTSTVSFTGVADQLLTPSGATLYQVVVNKATAGANTLRLAGDLTVSNQFSFSTGFVNTQNGAALNVLRLPDGATLANDGAGHYVLGQVEITRNAVSAAPVNFGHGAIIDPAGNNLGTVVITRTAGLRTADVSFGQHLSNAGLKGIDRIWTVAPAAQPTAGTPAQLTLGWPADNDNGITDFSQARIYAQTAAGQPWAVRGAVANASTRSIGGSFAALARFTVSNAANPLPVTLLDFAARVEGPAAVRLNWATASELNNTGFVVERSLDARSFAAIGTVAGAGTSTARHNYSLLDQQLPAGATLLYYRLRQTDVSGDFSYSPVRALALATQAAGFVVYPTKVGVGQAARYLYTGPAEAGTLEILNVVGQVLGIVGLDGRA